MCELLFNLAKSTELWAAIVGAIIGGLIAFVVQIISLREGRAQRREDNQRQREALGYSLLFKAIRILSNTHGIKEHFDESDLRAERDRISGEQWQIYLPVANPPDPISFSSEEMGMLLSLKDDEVFNSVLDTDVRHNSLVAALRQFNESRTELTQSISTAGRLRSEDGILLSHDLTNDTRNILRPKMIEVNGLADDVKETSHENFTAGQKNLFRLHALLKKELGLKFNLQMVAEKKQSSSSNA